MSIEFDPNDLPKCVEDVLPDYLLAVDNFIQDLRSRGVDLDGFPINRYGPLSPYQRLKVERDKIERFRITGG